jgi:hypothetical protein
VHLALAHRATERNARAAARRMLLGARGGGHQRLNAYIISHYDAT